MLSHYGNMANMIANALTNPTVVHTYTTWLLVMEQSVDPAGKVIYKAPKSKVKSYENSATLYSRT